MTIITRHVGIVVKDLNKSLNFWTKILGFNIYFEALEPSPYIDELIGIKNPELKTVKLVDANDFVIELLHYQSFDVEDKWKGSLSSNGLTHIALTVTDLDQLTVKLNSEGFLSQSKILYPPSGLVKVVFIKGPENLMLELVEELNV